MRNRRTVLVVDDEPASLELLCELLADSGVAVRVASSGRQALAQVAVERPDLVLLDIMMPGMDGIEALEKIRSQPGCSNLPAVFVTALDETEARSRTREAGPDEVLNKPVDVGRFGSTVAMLLAD